jgi:hypothetical protein|tara:strand:+ start:869 stop:1018 length:150 start_codon:yes stop_codon:yes gene_type:complete
MPRVFGNEEPKRQDKKTRQGLGRGTKWGTKNSKKHYKKKYRGQGGKRQR